MYKNKALDIDPWIMHVPLDFPVYKHHSTSWRLQGLSKINCNLREEKNATEYKQP